MRGTLMRYAALTALAAAGITALAGASGAVAKDGDKVVQGSCTGKSTSVLKAGVRDGGIETEWQVDSNVAGQSWGWRLKDNGVLVASGTKTTLAPRGSVHAMPRPPT